MNTVAAIALITATVVSPADKPRIAAVAAKMPVCVQQIIAAEVRHIVFVKPFSIYPDDGTTWVEEGLVIIDSETDDRTIYHEFGHLDGYFGHEEKNAAFIAAVKADFAAMPTVPSDLNYYRVPEEAWAELFANRYDPQDSPPIGLLSRAQSIEYGILAKEEKACE